MFKRLKGIVKKLGQRLTSNETVADSPSVDYIAVDLEANRQKLQDLLGSSEDIVFRDFTINLAEKQVDAFLVFVDGLVSQPIINESILKPLMFQAEYRAEVDSENTWHAVKYSLLAHGELQETNDFEQAVTALLSGDTIIFIAGHAQVLIADCREWETRGVDEPETESTVRGPREGFSETLRINTALLRRKIRSPYLRLETMMLGWQTKTEVSLVYLAGVAKPELVAEVRHRLQGIETDAILESGYIEEFIEDAPFAPFATIGNTEKPDVAAAKILEGRVVILTDGTPFVLTMPHLFVESFQISEDYYSRPYYSTFLRFLRLFSFAITVLLPGLYVAITTFHQEMLPTPLLLSMAAAREETPFPAIIEVLLMGIVFEILREAGVRLPRPVGQAVSIVGALVLGDAAVAAGLIGAPMVIVVGITAISSFVIPAQLDSAFILRFFYTILAGFLGIFGLMTGVLITLAYLVRLRSFGFPYLSPLAPISFVDWKDTFLRVPFWMQNTRPRLLTKAVQRQLPGMMPKPPKKILGKRRGGK